MDTGKIYEDSNGEQCSILQMVKREPHWAANRIQEGEKAIEKLAELESLLALFCNDARIGLYHHG